MCGTINNKLELLRFSDALSVNVWYFESSAFDFKCLTLLFCVSAHSRADSERASDAIALIRGWPFVRYVGVWECKNSNNARSTWRFAIYLARRASASGFFISQCFRTSSISFSPFRSGSRQEWRKADEEGVEGAQGTTRTANRVRLTTARAIHELSIANVSDEMQNQTHPRPTHRRLEVSQKSHCASEPNGL